MLYLISIKYLTMENIAILPLKINDAVLIIGKQSESVGFFNRALHRVEFGFSLNNPINSKKCNIAVFLTGASNDEIMMEQYNSALPNKYLTINFTNTFYDIWIDQSSIVIGTGDLRNGVFDTKQFILPNKAGELVFHSPQPNYLEIHYINDPKDIPYKHPSIMCNA